MFVSSPQQTQLTRLSFKTIHNGLSLLCISAVKNKWINGGSEVVESDSSDFDDFDGFDEEDAGDDEDEGMMIPFGKMRRWLENKPPGFGEGKVYDTSMEDKLLQEIQQGSEAQIANINKLKNEPLKPSSKKDEPKKKEPEDMPSGIRVRLFNLPKKKNIHRDLKSAFEGVPGIINIIPVVSGNKRTKDPICKGLAFVYFKSEDYATRFVQLFSRQIIAFGKVQKQIRCEMMNSSSSNSGDEHSADDTSSYPKITVNGFEEDLDADFGDNEDSYDSVMEAVSDVFDPDDELDFAELEEVGENLEFVKTVSELNGSNNTKQAKKSAADSSSSKQQKKIQAIEKKQVAKGKVKKVPKLDIPGSAKRLKIKEKAVLNDVFSKYAVKAASTAGEES